MPRAAPASRRKRAAQRFPHDAKLTRQRDFERVLAQGRRKRTRYFTLVAVPMGPGTRLGLVIGRRSSSRAIVRNRLKRIAREAFRHAELGALDIVIMARPGLDRVDRRELRSDLDRGLKELTEQCAGS